MKVRYSIRIVFKGSVSPWKQHYNDQQLNSVCVSNDCLYSRTERGDILCWIFLKSALLVSAVALFWGFYFRHCNGGCTSQRLYWNWYPSTSWWLAVETRRSDIMSAGFLLKCQFWSLRQSSCSCAVKDMSVLHT